MSAQATPVVDKMIFRKTNQHSGRRVSVTPANSTNKHLCYGRILLNSTTPSVSFSNGIEETGLICLSGAAMVKVAGQTFDLVPYDSIYIPRGSSIDVSTRSSVDFAEFSADVEGSYPLQFGEFGLYSGRQNWILNRLSFLS